MKRFLPALVLASLLVIPVVGLANDTGLQEAPEGPQTGGELVLLIEKIGNWAFTILLVVAVVFLIIAGFWFVTAQGDPEKINKARQMLINALIGIAIALLAKGLVAVIGSILGYTAT